MKISEAIEKLQKIKSKHGDISILACPQNKFISPDVASSISTVKEKLWSNLDHKYVEKDFVKIK